MIRQIFGGRILPSNLKCSKNTVYLIQILEEFQENCIAVKKLNFCRDYKIPERKLLYYPSSIIYHCVPANKMSKRYFRKWRFDQGEIGRNSSGRYQIFAIMHNVNSLTIEKMLRDIIVSLLKIGCFAKDRFDHELRICSILGFLSARMKRMRMKS